LYERSKRIMCNKRTKPEGVTQNIKLFRRGKATSRIPSCVGNKKLPKAPKRTGIIIKKTITTPWRDIVVRYLSELFVKKNCPGYANSRRIIVARTRPVKPDNKTKKK